MLKILDAEPVIVFDPAFPPAPPLEDPAAPPLIPPPAVITTTPLPTFTEDAPPLFPC